MATLSESLSPDQLQKLIDLHDQLQNDVPGPAARSAQTLANAPSLTPTESALMQGEGEGLGTMAQGLSAGADDSAGFLSRMASKLGSAGEAGSEAFGGLADKIRSALALGEGGGATLAGEGGAGLGEASGLMGPLGAVLAGMQSSRGPTDEDEAEAMEGGLFPNDAQQAQQLAQVGPQKPSQDNSSEDADEDDESVSRTVASPQAQAKAKQQAQQSQASPASTDYLQNMLDKLYGSNKNALSDAEAQRNKQLELANSMRVGNIFAKALSRGAWQGDNSLSDSLTKEAANPVNDVALKQRLIDEQMGTAVKAQDLNDRAALKDPNSAISAAYRNLAGQLTPQLKGSPDFDSMSAEAIKNAQPTVDMAIRSQALNMKQQAMMDFKNGQNSDKAYTDMRKSLETFRGNQAAQQAAKNVLSADNAISIVGNKDPNTLTTQDLRLLVGEIGKIATSGVPTEHGSADLMPHNLQTKWAEMKNFLTSSPTDAEAGEYIARNMRYLQDMKTNSQNVLSTFRGNIAKGFKNRVRPDDYQEAINDYGLGGASQGQSNAHPQDDAAVAWAKANPSDPRAAQIMKANGQ